jgi:hypothetical protein
LAVTLVIPLHPFASVTVIVELAQTKVFSLKVTSLLLLNVRLEIVGAELPTVTAVEAVSARTIADENNSATISIAALTTYSDAKREVMV